MHSRIPGDRFLTLARASATVIAVLIGSQLGSRLMAERLKSKAVKQVFGWVLLGVALLIIVKDVILG